LSFDPRVQESLEILDRALGDRGEGVVVAYSGGKDSTALALLLLDWIDLSGRPLTVTLLHGDTLSEIPEVEYWARAFAERYLGMLSRRGSRGVFRVVRPEPWESFYWRALIRGYAAPSFKWRWCVELLKRRPSLRFLSGLGGGAVVLLGHRDSESPARARALSLRTRSCPLAPGSCFAYYMSLDSGAERVYPIRSWRDRDVWAYLRRWQEKLGILGQLFHLYGYGLVPARYGCWHCTLVKVQLGHVVLGGGHLYFEAVRKIYRAVNDLPELRAAKDRGYSSRGFLLAPARSLILNAMSLAERLSGIRLYGLDESRVGGLSLREIFLEVPEGEADRVIGEVERATGGDPRRVAGVGDLRDLDRHRKALERVYEHPLVKEDKHAGELLDRLL
jgi:DNA sulfur modification protein DndC